jgi:hypothetical protein
MQKLFPKGTILYRFGPLSLNKCPDTGKTGIYFSLHIVQSMMMSVEYVKPGDLHTIELDEDVYAYEGKYSYRTDRYFNNGRLIPHLQVLPEENINHCDETLVLDSRFPDTFTELFLTSIPRYTHQSTIPIDPDYVNKLIASRNFSPFNKDY